MRILVVDDHQPTRELMRLTLTSLGHSVTSATTVAEALERLDDDTPDVILSDLTFPSTADDGHDLARAVRSHATAGEIGLLAVTGSALPGQRQAALDSGFDGVLVKPFDLEALIEQIQAVGGDR